VKKMFAVSRPPIAEPLSTASPDMFGLLDFESCRRSCLYMFTYSMEIWQLHLVMAFSCLLVFTLAAAAIRRYFLGRRHLKSEFQGPRRKGDGPIARSEKQIAAESAAIDAVAVKEVFSVANAALSVAASDVDVNVHVAQGTHRRSAIDNEHAAAVRRFPSMKSASDEEVARISQHIRLVCVAPGEHIFTAGSAANTAYVIKSGAVSLLSGADENGNEGSRRQLSDGDWFGEQALETTETYSSTAVATSECHLWILERSKVALALPSSQELSKRSVFQNVSLKSVAAAALVSSHMFLRHSTPEASSVELVGVSQPAPSLVPQQQAPSALISSRAAAWHQPPHLDLSFGHAAASLQASSLEQAQVAAAASAAIAGGGGGGGGGGGAVSRVPKSLLKKHAMLFDSESNEL
jgi:hypothetical protein